MFASPDGFTFRKLDPQPEIVSKLPNSFDGGNTMFWSDVEQQYVLYFRIWDGERSIGRMTSKDFLHWSEPVPMTYGDSPREQLYTNQTQPYFRASHLYIAPAARFMERRRVVTDEQVQAIGLKTSQGHFYGNDCADAVLLTTRAGSPCPGFSLDDCSEIIGDEIHRVVRWRSGSDVSALASRHVRLRFVIRDGDLFAIQFRE